MKQKKQIFGLVLLLALSVQFLFIIKPAKALDVPQTEAEGTYTNPFFEGIITDYIPDSAFCPAFVTVVNDQADVWNFMELPGKMDGYWDIYDPALDPITNDPGILIKGSMFPLTVQEMGLYWQCPIPIYPMVEAGTSLPPALGE